VVDFPLTRTGEEFVAALHALHASGWVDQRTRLVLFDHLIYNNEHNAFVSVRVSFELQPWGFVRARVHARTMRLGYVRGLDVGLLVLDGLVYANVLISLTRTLVKLVQLRGDFFKSQLNMLDLCNYTCFMVTLYFKIALNLFTGEMLATPPSPQDGYSDFDYVGATVKNISVWNGFNSLITWAKALTYIALCHRAPSMLIKNIMRSASNVAVLICLFLLILWAYAQALYICFGTQLEQWKNVNISVLQALGGVLGGLDVDQLRGEDQLLGVLIWMSYLFLCVIFVVNTFLAIIMYTYEEITSEVIGSVL